MLGQRLRRWPNIEPTMNKCISRVEHEWAEWTRSAAVRRILNVDLGPKLNDRAVGKSSKQIYPIQEGRPVQDPANNHDNVKPAKGALSFRGVVSCKAERQLLLT